MAKYVAQRTAKGRVRRILLRYMKIAEIVDDEWYRVVTANPENTPSFCVKHPKTREAYVKIREWHSGCDRVNAYTRVEE